MSLTPAIEEHPDIAAMRLRYEQAAETPTAQAVDGLTFLTGLYLAMSPWVVGFSDHSSLTANNLFTGIAVALLALGFASAFGRTHGIAWVAPVIGVWTAVAPWIVSGPAPSTAAVINNVAVGLLCVLFTLGTLSVGMRGLSGSASKR